MKNHFMALRLWRAACLTSALVLAGAPATQLVAQITSSSIAGVLRTAAGAPIANATITATHVPTGTTYTAVTSAQGRYNFINVIVGGPYTVSTEASGAQSAVAKNITAQLGSSSEVNLVAGESEVVVLDALEVTAATNDLNPASAGAGNQYSSAELATRPTSERSLADLVSASPFVTIRALSGDREEANITALGQNNRYNSFQIDGSRINDQFGLNSTGLASFFNPISVEWIEQLAVQVSPYDVRQAGFTGASINAVTKSGSNQFSGGSYYLFQGDNAFGVQTRGENANEKTNSNRTVKPKLEQSTYGFYLGGPIIPDRLFFFAGYEKFKRESAPRDATFRANDEAAILTRLAQYNTASGRSIPWGAPVTGATSNIAEDEKVMVKLDWNIINSQRVSVRYLTAEGQVPQFGRFGGTSLTTNLPNSFPSSGVTTTPTGGFYSQERKEESWAASLNSQWTPDLKSELKYATTKQDQTTPTAVTAPEIYIFNLPGTNLQTGAAVTNGGYVLGTEQFRHGNQINVSTDQYSYVADYINGDIVYSAGVEREESEFYNLFRQSSYGRIGYTSLANFLNDVVAASDRNVYDPAIRPVADVSEFATTGVFAQADWDISSRFKVTAGLRYEVNSQPDAPKFNQKFLTDTGFRNDGTLDGAEYISPRLSFNYSLDDKRITQIRGGAGHFTGRAPWVFFSNSYGQTGVGSFTQTGVASTLTNYLQNSFNPASPIATGTDAGTDRREINWVDGDIELPSVWRMNLAVDRKVEFLSTVASVEVVQTITDNALFITNENLRATTIGADGRQRFAGNPSTLANARYAQYTDLYRVKNSDVGASRYLSFSWARPMKNKWGFNAAYVLGDSTEAQATGQTTAAGQWQRNIVFNQGQEEKGTSDYEIRHRFVLSATRDFEFVKNWRSRVSLAYEGRTGNPYSFVYNTDLNGDGQNTNDRVAVPSGASDARFDFSGLSASQLDTYLANFRGAGLDEYAGGVAPKNAFREPFINRLDLKLSQQIPMHRSLRTELFLDFINFGSFIREDLFNYREQSNLLSNDVFRRRTVGGATYGSDGRIVVAPANVAAPSALVIDNTQSRWRIQIGARITF